MPQNEVSAEELISKVYKVGLRLFFNNFSSTKANTLVLWQPRGSHLNLSFIFIIIMIIVPHYHIVIFVFDTIIPLS